MVTKQIGSRSYFYKSIRDGEKTRSEYIGTGPVAELAAVLDEIRQQERAEARADERRRLEEIIATDRELARYHRGVQLLFKSEMLSRGMHDTNGAPWRRRRVRMTKSMTKTKAKANRTPAAPPRTFSLEQVQAIVARGQEGDETALVELRAAFATAEWGSYLTEVLGSPAVHLNDALIGRIATADGLAVRDAMERHLAALRKQLTPADPQPLEELLVSRIVTCWLAVAVVERQAALWEVPNRGLDVLDRRVTRAHCRLLSAIRALVAIRRPDGPGVAVQTVVNVSTIEAVVAAPLEQRDA